MAIPRSLIRPLVRFTSDAQLLRQDLVSPRALLRVDPTSGKAFRPRRRRILSLRRRLHRLDEPLVARVSDAESENVLRLRESKRQNHGRRRELGRRRRSDEGRRIVRSGERHVEGIREASDGAGEVRLRRDRERDAGDGGLGVAVHVSADGTRVRL